MGFSAIEPLDYTTQEYVVLTLADQLIKMTFE
jgi:hypothetical protein